MELLTKQLCKEQGVTEELKEKAPMQWVGLMNNIRSQAGGSNTERADFQLAEPEPATDGRGSVANEEEVRANLPTVEEQMEMIAEAEDEKILCFFRFTGGYRCRPCKREQR